jgi:hypothetical protein
VNNLIAETLSSAAEISIEFGISYESAKIYFEELTALRDRGNAAEKIRRIADEFRQSVTPVASKLRFINEVCTVCGNQTVFPVGSKFMCQTPPLCDEWVSSRKPGRKLPPLRIKALVVRGLRDSHASFRDSKEPIVFSTDCSIKRSCRLTISTARREEWTSGTRYHSAAL